MGSGAVGQVLGRQIAGDNVLDVAAPVPAPQTRALFAAGLRSRSRSRQA